MIVLLSVIPLLTVLVACGDDDDPLNTGLGITPQLTTGLPGGTVPPGDPEDLLSAHIRSEFGDEEWAGDVGETSIEDGKATVTLDRSADDGFQQFDELCTAAAGFLISGDANFGVDEVEVVDSSGQTVAETRDGRPQCYPA